MNKLLHDIRQAPPNHITILETGYSMLYDIGDEEKGYGLYSYAILNNNNRSATFLKDVFEAIPGADKKDTAAHVLKPTFFTFP